MAVREHSATFGFIDDYAYAYNKPSHISLKT
jgi:hypothetical protein